MKRTYRVSDNEIEKGAMQDTREFDCETYSEILCVLRGEDLRENTSLLRYLNSVHRMLLSV